MTSAPDADLSAPPAPDIDATLEKIRKLVKPTSGKKAPTFYPEVKPTETLPVVFYARYSDPRQNINSIKRQFKECAWHVRVNPRLFEVGRFASHGETGMKRDREDLALALEECRQGRAKGIVVG